VDSSESANSVTANGNAQIDTAQSKFGGASGLFDGTGDYLSLADSADWVFGTGDFTIDGWVRFNNLPGVGDHQFLYAQFLDDQNGVAWFAQYAGGIYYISFSAVSAGSPIVDVSWNVSAAFAINTWYHLAIIRSGNYLYLFKDGSQVGSAASLTGIMPDVAASLYIGSTAWSINYAIDGWLDEFRVSKGVARWTSSFTPPTRPYGTLRASDITVSGNVGIGTTDPGYPLTLYKAASETGILTQWGSSSVYLSHGGWNMGAGKFGIGDGTAPSIVVDTSTDYVGIGTTTPTNKLNIEGSGNALNISSGASCSYIAAGSTAFTACSSREIKENIQPFAVNGILQKISSVPVSRFDFINGSKDNIGLIAEDFYPILQRGDNRTVSGQDVQMALWLAVQELTKENSQLKARLDSLESRIALLEVK